MHPHRHPPHAPPSQVQNRHAGHTPEMFRDRFLVCLLLTLPVLYASQEVRGVYAEGLEEKEALALAAALEAEPEIGLLLPCSPATWSSGKPKGAWRSSSKTRPRGHVPGSPRGHPKGPGPRGRGGPDQALPRPFPALKTHSRFFLHPSPQGEGCKISLRREAKEVPR